MPPATPQKGGKNFSVILFETSISIPLRFLSFSLSKNVLNRKRKSLGNLFCFFNFQVSGLNSGRGLKITIYAANANGRSPNIVLEGFTLKVAELQLGKPFFQAPFFSFSPNKLRLKDLFVYKAAQICLIFNVLECFITWSA